jgi:hypothetical protein
MDENIVTAFVTALYCTLVVLSFLIDKRPC